jgi:superoxide dismutase
MRWAALLPVWPELWLEQAQLRQAQASEGAPATGAPLIALDMYEHAFHMDYGAAAAKYVDAFMRNLDWEIVEKRFSAAVARI